MLRRQVRTGGNRNKSAAWPCTRKKDARFNLGSDRQQPLSRRAWMVLGSCGLT